VGEKFVSDKFDDTYKKINHLFEHIAFAGEKGSSSWPSVLPTQKYGHALHKQEFIDIIYGGRVPTKLCSNFCEKFFSVEHSLSC